MAQKKKKKTSRAVKKKSAASRTTSSRVSVSQEAFLQINESIWPLERDVLFRPDRYKYVRKVLQTTDCVFCQPAVRPPQIETLCLHQTRYSMIVLNKFPYNSGHLLILPLRHCGDLMDLNVDEFTDLHATLKIAMQACQQIYQPQGFNLGMNHGAVAGAGIPQHLHYHLIPRWAGDLNFFPLIAETKVVIESLEQSYSRYKEYFQSL